jgi:hypothetical protein
VRRVWHWVRLLPWRWQLRRAGYRLADPARGWAPQWGRQYTYHLDGSYEARRQVVLTMVHDYEHRDIRLAYSRARLARMVAL